jgi:purine-binding chemotaxis protein CheW
MEQPELPQIPQSQQASVRPAGQAVRVCLISLGGEVFAVDLRNVREVFEVEGITPVPAMPPALAGVANLRGTIVPIADLRSVLRLPANDPLPFAVVIRHGGRQVGVLVDRVPEIRTIHMEDLLPASTGGSEGPKPFVSSVLQIEGRIGGVVEVPTLMAYVETS